ncbi:MAG TPA: beta-galactosidase [Opitutaceae bacterium]|nr:beta-galactosidase [Opitutaceae bacterium]
MKRLLPVFAAVSLLSAAPAPLPPGAPMELTLGSDELTATTPAVDAQLETLRALGYTSIQSYIYWSKVEPKRGTYDWSLYESNALLYKRHGIKLVPFVVAGPWYLTPEFVRTDPAVTMLRCLEHGRDSKIPSIWSPAMKQYVRTYLAAFAQHFRPLGVIESVIIGITGDYGEAIYSVLGNWPGEYHSHAGFWCGDPLAAADFQAYVKAHYPAGIDALNQSWRSHYASFADVKPFPPLQAPSERAWQEELAWYRGAMTDYAEFWLKTAREFFPDEEIYLCTGGDMAAEHGSDFSAQAKIAAKYGAGVRITNEASSFPMNVRLTRMVGSAGRFYGAYVGHEPASVVTPVGYLGRIFNAFTSGNRQLHTYGNGLLGTPVDGRVPLGPAGEFVQKYHGLLRATRPVIETALYSPNPLSTDTWADREGFSDLASQLRRFVDYDFADDHLIADGILKDKSLLIVANTRLMSAETVTRIADWVRQGGVVYFLGSRPLDWDGKSVAFDDLAGLPPGADEAVGISGLVVREPKLLLSIAAKKDLMTFDAFTAATPDCQPLLGAAYSDKLQVAWRRPVGKGQVFAYYGPMDLKVTEAAWTVAEQLPLHFVKDTLELCIAQGWLRQVPASLVLGMDDLFMAQTDSGLWILNMRNTPQKVKVRGELVEVPAQSIIKH